jgi:hypothetical protein
VKVLAAVAAVPVALLLASIFCVEEVRVNKDQELPFAEVAKITGNAHLSNGYLFGDPYNGSDWDVTRVLVNVSVMEKDGSVRWSRDFSEATWITPLTTGRFAIKVTGPDEITRWTWKIKKAFGYRTPPKGN